MRRLGFPLLVMGVLVSGCADSQYEVAESMPASDGTAPILGESVIAAVEGLDGTELQEISALRLPDGVEPFTIDKMIPEMDQAVLQNDSGETVEIKGNTAQGEEVVTVVNRGDVADFAANYFGCAWVSEFEIAANANDQQGMDEALGQLEKISSLKTLQQLDTEVPSTYEDEIIPRLKDEGGDFAAGYVERNCANLVRQ